MNTPTDCAHFRDALLDDQHGRLAGEPARELHDHLQTCVSCASLDRQERWLSDLLRTKLPRPRAPRALRERLLAELSPAAGDPVPPPPLAEPSHRAWWRLPIWSAGLAAAALLAAATLFYQRPPLPTQSSPTPSAPLQSSHDVFREAVNDHLRVIYAQNPIEIESGGIHQVKPWFTGRLDFAPDVAFSGDSEFPLVGGAVGYFIDRKAATFVFKHRLHTISCFVFRAHDLQWPHGAREQAIPDGPNAHVSALDGFHVVLWREDELGHACVSDVAEADLMALASKLARH
jgi:anti-sigma factor RsiW